MNDFSLVPGGGGVVGGVVGVVVTVVGVVCVVVGVVGVVGAAVGGEGFALHEEGLVNIACSDASYISVHDPTLPTPALHFSDNFVISWLVRNRSHTFACVSRSLLEPTIPVPGPKFTVYPEVALKGWRPVFFFCPSK